MSSVELTCEEILLQVKKDRDIIINSIDTFLKDNNSKEDIINFLDNSFRNEIIKFREKYQNSTVMVFEENKKKCIADKCNEQLKEEVHYLMSYIEKLKE